MQAHAEVEIVLEDGEEVSENPNTYGVPIEISF
jgi:hypothetical protein